jgi:hypothetical protein
LVVISSSFHPPFVSSEAKVERGTSRGVSPTTCASAVSNVASGKLAAVTPARDSRHKVFRWLHRRQSIQPIACIPVQLIEKFSGGYIEGDPPVPIPNTEVKPFRADGTARFPCGRVGRCRNFSPRALPREQSPRAPRFTSRGFFLRARRCFRARPRARFGLVLVLVPVGRDL